MKKILLLAVAAVMAVSANAQFASKSDAKKAMGNKVISAQEVKAASFTVSPALNRVAFDQNKTFGSQVARPAKMNLTSMSARKVQEVDATYTGKGKDKADAKMVTWNMNIGTYTTESGATVNGISNVCPSIFDDDDMVVMCTYTDTQVTVEPQLVASTSNYDLWVAALNADDGILVINRDPNTGYLTLPEGEGVIIGAFNAGSPFDPTYASGYAGYWQITENVVYYAEGQDVETVTPTPIINASDNGQLFAGLSPSGYSYNYNLSMIPAFCDFTVNNYTSDEATAWDWQASKMGETDVEETFSSKDFNFTFPVVAGTYKDIQLSATNINKKSLPVVLGVDGTEYEDAYVYASSTQDEFSMSDGTMAVMSSQNPMYTLKFYTNWATPDKYSTSMSKIYSYGFKPVKPLYIEGIEVPMVAFVDNGGFNLTCKIVKATRNGKLTFGDVIAQCDATIENVDETYASTSGLTMINFNNFYAEDEDGMTVDVDHLFLDEEFAIVLEGWDNGTFTGVLGSQETSPNTPSTTWFEKTGAEGSQYSYSEGWPTLFIGYQGAAYGYLNTEDDTNITLSGEGGEATIHVEPMLCSVAEDESHTTRLMVDSEIPEWLTIEVASETYTETEYSFDLKVSAEASSEEREATVRLYQEGAYIDLNVKQTASAGINSVSTNVVKGGKMYDLNGKEVGKNFKGIAVSKGGKFLIK